MDERALKEVVREIIGKEQTLDDCAVFPCNEFKVGEDFKAMILSVAEGDDKPSKYPLMFHESKVLLINKIDLLPYVDCSVEKIIKAP